MTAAVVQELYGGDILKTALGEDPHYYNRVNGRVIDFTNSQFTDPISYDDACSNRDEALNGIPAAEYDALKTAVLVYLRRG